MSLHLPPESPVNFSGVVYSVAGIVIITIVVLLKLSQRPTQLDTIPAVGSTTWLDSWWTTFKCVNDAHGIIQAGYRKYNSAPFRVPQLYHWLVVISNRRCVEELARASDDEFSFLEAIDDVSAMAVKQLHVRCTLGREIIDNSYHVGVIHSQLTRNLHVLFPGIRDEIVASFDDVLNLRGNEWKSIPALRTIEEVVCRTSNRAFVGLPLCRDPDWIRLNIRYTMDTFKGGAVVGLFPAFMRAFATRFLTNIPRNLGLAMNLLGPIIEERWQYLDDNGVEWDNKPNDVLLWLMEQAEGSELTTERLTNRILVVNSASNHSSSHFFTQVIFRLASNPHHINTLREEIEDIVEKDGWSKTALAKMQKVDSFLKECQRVEGVNTVTLLRKALKDFTFSDGTFIPKGTMVATATRSLHHDGDFYENPETFEPFRFVGKENGMGFKGQFTSTTAEYLPFGHGKHACPGRFFAANELKAMLAHVVVTYDVRLEDNTRCPASSTIGTFISANPHAKIMLRNRID